MKYFIGDIHAGHDRVLIGLRKKFFPTIKEWNDGIFDIINTKVRRNHTLYLLGDYCLRDVEIWRPRIKCKNVILIMGNHDPSMNRCKKVFGEHRVYDVKMVKIKDNQCWLSHYAHAYWPQSHYGSMHLYGHNHGQREQTLDVAFPGRRSMDVGPEPLFRMYGEWGPVSEECVYETLMARRGHDDVSYYKALEKYADK